MNKVWRKINKILFLGEGITFICNAQEQFILCLQINLALKLKRKTRLLEKDR